MNKTLVILAAGMGSRFGGLKQITPMGPNGEFIIDYSIYDAIKAGFNKVVFIIKEENLKDFKETIGKRIEKVVKTEYVFQNNDNVPDEYDKLKNREKPLGTAHAVLCCKDVVKEPFLVINADDFYSYDAFKEASEYLENNNSNTKPYHYGMVVYNVENTILAAGPVKRGVCEVKDGRLMGYTESRVEEVDGKIYAEALSGCERKEVPIHTPVNMNVLALEPTIFPYLENEFKEFLEKNKDNPENCEMYIPEVMFDTQRDNYALIDAITTTGVWHGVTYKEDTPEVKRAIQKLIEDKEYPSNLWSK